jgi:16S rRNA pseudouridine516 synthase
MRLDRLIRKDARLSSREARDRLAAGEVFVNGEPERDGSRRLAPFDHVMLGNTALRASVARYVLLHKPAGYVSATTDREHPTVIDLIAEPWASELHLAGRLDRFTTGLVILTNDSRFSEALTVPKNHVAKRYRVETESPITEEAVSAFRCGMEFAKEQITTHPAIVDRIHPHAGLLTIYEGKHHQVKRMFARFGIKVTKLHREVIGPFELDVPEGSYRELSPAEVATVLRPEADM